MKAIAEYFRDLAADDRYFGAEPPQPDAEMLARIAEREISRRVEARRHEGQIVLSATQAAAAAAAPATIADTPAPAAEQAERTSATEGLVADLVEDEARASARPDEAPVADDMNALAAEAAVDEVEADAVAEDETAAADGDDIEPADAVAEAETQAADDEAEAFFADAAPMQDAYDDEEDTATAHADDVAVAEAVEPAAPPAPDSIAAKLQRIRAVVSQSQEAAAEDEMFEDEHAEDFASASDLAKAPDENADAFEEDEKAGIDDDASVDDFSYMMPEEDVSEEPDGEDEVASILARFDAEDAEDAAPQAAETPEAPAEESADIGFDSLAAMLDSDEDDGDAPENLFDAEPELTRGDAEKEHDTADGGAAPRRARVIKVKRADIDAAIASGRLEAMDDDEDEDEDDVSEAPAQSSLSDEDEAELMAELAEVEAELPTADADASDDMDDDEPEAVAEADAAEHQEKPVDDGDVSRLMAEADHQMEEPEGSRRRNAFAHLKAAVMAKKADANIGEDTVKDEGAFRSDLASVVVPRRPAAPADKADRPATSRPAPLKLVAEQRVDIENPGSAAGPVRPRRVAAADEAAESEAHDGGFADYAAEMGAHSLPALLEAAASYLSFVEGRDQFSRPQLMTKVRQVEKEDFSREDGMRSLGQLLRAGKLEKRKGGRFVVTDDIGYRPDQRAAS